MTNDGKAVILLRVSIWLYILEQMGITGCLLLAIGLSAGLKRCSMLRVCFVATVVGSLSAWVTDSPAVIRAGMLLLCAMTAPLLAWPQAPRRLYGRMIASGCFLSLGVTGMMRFVQPFALPSALAVLVCCLLLRLVPALLPRQEEIPRLATIDIRHGAHHLTLTALIDSGNLLRDNVTGLPVVVVSRRAAERLVQLPERGRLTYPFRLLTVRTISGTGMMTVFHPDSVCVQTPEGWQRVETLLGVSPEGYDGFQALVPAGLIRKNEAALVPAGGISEI